MVTLHNFLQICIYMVGWMDFLNEYIEQTYLNLLQGEKKIQTTAQLPHPQALEFAIYVSVGSKHMNVHV